jgi:PEP-CTERM motif
MKVTNLRGRLYRALLAAGIWMPSMAYAVEIPLGDPSFDAFTVPAFPLGVGYAYSDTYRPTSAWVDDLDSPPDGSGGPSDYYLRDDGKSNWLYNAAYAASTTRPLPRTGNQAMHGLGYYSAQETGAVFEAGQTYTFSLWQQADSDFVASRNGVFLYFFDATRPFSEANSLAVGTPTPALPGTWTQISLSHIVLPGAPEIGNPIGVAFFPRSDTAVDDATLTAVPEPGTFVLIGLGGIALGAVRRRRQ